MMFMAGEARDGSRPQQPRQLGVGGRPPGVEETGVVAEPVSGSR